MESLKDPVRGETPDAAVVRCASLFRSDACQEKFPGPPEAFVPVA